MRIASLLLLGIVGTASADPAATGTSPATSTTNAATPATPPPVPILTGLLIADIPPPPPVSLRLEMLRVATQNWEESWRYPEPGTLGSIEGGTFFMGYGRYQPRTRRSAALHGASIGATLAGEILLGSGSPLAGVGALLTGAALDAAAADVDRDSETRRGR